MDIKFADFAQAAYLMDNAPDMIQNFNKLKALSDSRSLCYISGRYCIISVRGTIMTIPRDLYLDTLVFQNKLDSATEIQVILNKIKQMFNGGYEVYLTGHSLGGSICLECVNLLPDMIEKVIIFNPGFGPKAWIKKNKNRFKCKFIKSDSCDRDSMVNQKIIILTAGFDPISLLSRFSGFNSSNKSASLKSSHNLSNFL